MHAHAAAQRSHWHPPRAPTLEGRAVIVLVLEGLRTPLTQPPLRLPGSRSTPLASPTGFRYPECMPSSQRPKAQSSAFLIIDVQEKLAPAMPSARLDDIERCVRVATTASQQLKIPGLVTEQYPQGLGPSVAAIREHAQASDYAFVEKTQFSGYGAAGVREFFAQQGTQTVFVIGMETHICVYQSARDMIDAGLNVHVLIDGVCSRRDDHRQVGLELCRQAGATISTTETVVFDLLADAQSPGFRELSRAIR